MKLYVLILNEVKYLYDLLYDFMEAGVRGATIYDSMGAVQYFGHERNTPPMFGSLRKYLHPDNENNKTILILLDEEKLETVREIVDRVTGGLDKPNVGIAFTLPVDSVDGWLKR